MVSHHPGTGTDGEETLIKIYGNREKNLAKRSTRASQKPPCVSYHPRHAKKLKGKAEREHGISESFNIQSFFGE